MSTSTFRDELKLGTEIYSEELQRKIDKTKRELDHIMALKKALEEGADDQKIKEIDQEHKVYQRTKRREEKKLREENSVQHISPRDYVPNEVSFGKLIGSYLKILRNKERKNETDQILNRRTTLSYRNLHRPLRSRMERLEIKISLSAVDIKDTNGDYVDPHDNEFIENLYVPSEVTSVETTTVQPSIDVA